MGAPAASFLDNLQSSMQDYLKPAAATVGGPALPGDNAVTGQDNNQQPAQLQALLMHAGQSIQPQGMQQMAPQAAPPQDPASLAPQGSSHLEEILRLGTIEYLKNLLKQAKGEGDGQQAGQPAPGGSPAPMPPMGGQ